MGKNRRYKNTYQVTISGTTTNGFAAKITDKIIKTVVQALNNSGDYNAKVEISVVETIGDFDAINEKTNP